MRAPITEVSVFNFVYIKLIRMNGCFIFVLGFFSETLRNCSASNPFGGGDNNDNRHYFQGSNYNPQNDQAFNYYQQLLRQMEQATQTQVPTNITNPNVQNQWSGIGQTSTAVVPVTTGIPFFDNMLSERPTRVSRETLPTHFQDFGRGSTSGEGSSVQRTEPEYKGYLNLPMVKGHIKDIQLTNGLFPGVSPESTGRDWLYWSEANEYYPYDIEDEDQKKALTLAWNKFCWRVKLLITPVTMQPIRATKKRPYFTLINRLEKISQLKIHYTLDANVYIYSDLVKCVYSDHSDFFIAKFNESTYFILDYIPADGDKFISMTCLKIKWLMTFLPAKPVH